MDGRSPEPTIVSFREIKENSIFSYGIDRKKFLSYVPSDDDIKSLQREYREDIENMCLFVFQCTRCCRFINPRTNYGSWKCTSHWGSIEDHIWTCCGTDTRILSSPYRNGCRAADHRSAIRPQWHRADRFEIAALLYYALKLFEHTRTEAIAEVYVKGAGIQVENGPKTFNHLEYKIDDDVYLISLANILFVIDRMERTEDDNKELDLV